MEDLSHVDWSTLVLGIFLGIPVAERHSYCDGPRHLSHRLRPDCVGKSTKDVLRG
jgi:hypothetical protein